MEMHKLEFVNVHTLLPTKDNNKISVPVKEGCVSSAAIHQKVCRHLGLKQTSWKYFSLFDGFIKRKRRLKDTDIKIPVEDLWLLKWCYCIESECRLVKSDDLAANLIYREAKHRIDAGLLCPTREEEEKLEEFSEPDFILEKDYVFVCHGMDQYFIVTVSDCVVVSQLVWEEHMLLQNTKICLDLTKYGFWIISASRLFVSWFNVKSWELTNNKDIISYAVQWETPIKHNDKIALCTNQAEYILATTTELVQELQFGIPDAPSFHVSMIKRKPDGSTVWENALFGLRKQ